MTDSKKVTVIPPAAVPARGSPPVASLPSLPSSSGAFWGSATTIMKKDCRFVQAHTEFLQARTAQAASMAEVVEARVNLATVIAKLQTVDEIIAHEYQRGRADRQSEQAQWIHARRMTELQHEREALDAQAALMRAQQRLAELQPKPPEPAPPPPPPPPVGLSPSDVEKVAHNMPELKPETVQSLVWALKGLLAENSK